METECHNNIIELHVFIESWLKGTIERTKQKFQYFEDELDDDFIIISPSGNIQNKREIISDFWNAYGVQPTDFKIEIKNIKIRSKSENVFILNYEEWQTREEKTARISTVVFRKKHQKQ